LSEVRDDPASPTTSTDAKATKSADALFDAVYTRLKAMAGRQLAHRPAEASLDTTALVHELYLRVVRTASLRSPTGAVLCLLRARCVISCATARATAAPARRRRLGADHSDG
jgi:hypothetical protein